MNSLQMDKLRRLDEINLVRFIEGVFGEDSLTKERKLDMDELFWLIEQCRQLIVNYTAAIEYAYEQKLMAVFATEVEVFHERVMRLLDIASEPYFGEFLKIKYDIRKMLKQLSSVIYSGDWQSPAKSSSLVSEHGNVQIETDRYMRISGSEYVKNYQRKFLAEFYPMAETYRERTIGYLTSSGMKALELALILYQVMSSDDPVYFHSNFYYEGRLLLTYIFEKAVKVSPVEIYQKLRSEEEIGCLALTPAPIWPCDEKLDLTTLFELLQNHRQKKPLFIIMDRTECSIADELFIKYAGQIPGYVIFITFESLLKHYQYGLDITNLGFITITTRFVKQRYFRDLVDNLLHQLTAIPDHSVVQRLPLPNADYTKRRLARVARNCNILYSFFKEEMDEKRVWNVLRPIDPKANMTVLQEQWNGSLIFIQSQSNLNVESYYKLIRFIMEGLPRDLSMVEGQSFGFDTMRLGVVDELYNNSNCALRISVGRDDLYTLMRKIIYLHRVLSTKINLL